MSFGRGLTVNFTLLVTLIDEIIEDPTGCEVGAFSSSSRDYFSLSVFPRMDLINKQRDEIYMLEASASVFLLAPIARSSAKPVHE